jgi:hypothetical protein
MIAEVVYTETYKFTLTALINNVEGAYGTSLAEKLLRRIDGIVKKNRHKSLSLSSNPNRRPVSTSCYFTAILIGL